MSVAAMTAVWNYDIPPNFKIVLLAYADNADQDGCNIWPASDTIKKKTGYKEREVQYITKALREAGLLQEDGKGPRGTNRWLIPMRGGAIIAPVQSLQGAIEMARRGAKNDDDLPEIGDVIAPELNVLTNTTDKEIKTETSPGFLALQSAASQIWPTDTSQWRVLKAALLRSEIEMQDGAIRVTGLGQAAAMFQANYGRAFERALVGVLNQTTEVRFEE